MRSNFQLPNRISIAVIVLLALTLRLVHLGSAVDNPFSYHLGPDEDYYLRFGKWLAGLANGDPAEFAFMDPAYAYLLGMVFKLFGPNTFVVLALQALIDTLTALLIFFIGRELGRPRGGFYGAFLYALTATAIMYTATFLKVTLVANAIALWTLLALLLLRSDKAYHWLLFGLFCGYCVALRSNLALLAILAVLLLPWLYRKPAPQSGQAAITRAALLLAGLALPLMVLTAHNFEHSQKLSPLPNNGGTVLHQVYNRDNPRAESWYPPFAPYTHPTEILRGYAAEAERRTKRVMTPGEVDGYWREQALDYIYTRPGQAVANIGRKTLEFASYTEVANNRSMADERLFSTVLRTLPAPFGWLFALGVPGLILLVTRDRKGFIVLAPIIVVVATFTIFFAEARFRFHAVPLIALGAGLFLEDLIAWFRSGQSRKLVWGLAATIMMGGVSVWASQRVAQPQVSWEGIAWGYIKMGDLGAAEKTLNQVPAGEITSAKWEEALGFIAWSKQDFETASGHYQRAVDINPGSHIAHYNLAMMLARTGHEAAAARHAEMAFSIARLPEYQQLIQNLSTP